MVDNQEGSAETQGGETQHGEYNYSPIAVIRDTFTVLRMNLVPLLILNSIPILLVIIFEILLKTSLKTLFEISITFSLIFIIVILLMIIVLLILTPAAVVYIVHRTLIGQKISILSALKFASKHFLRIISTSIVYSLVVGLAMQILIVPGIIATCVFLVAFPACVVESKGSVDSLVCSAELTKGLRVKIFFTLLLLAIILGIFVIISIIASVSVITYNISSLPYIVALITLLPIYIILYTFLPVLYFELRAIKDGLNADNIANIFDQNLN